MEQRVMARRWVWPVVVLGCLGAAVVARAQGQLTRPPRLLHQAPVQLPKHVEPVAADTPVVLQLTLDDTGQVTRVEVVESAHPDLDHAAMGAACGFGFEPAEVDGEPSAIQLNYRYIFTVPRSPAVEDVADAGFVVDASTPPDGSAPDAGVADLQDQPQLSPGLATFTGVVLEAATRAPVADVELYIQVAGGEPLVANTSEDGRFEVRDVPPGRHMVALTATGFEQYSVVEEFRESETLSAEYPLRKLGSNTFETVVRDRLRRAGRVTFVAGSIHTIGEKDLERTAPTSANEVLRTIPGVNVVDEEGIGLRPNVGIRGTDPNRSRKILVLEDGAPIALQPYGEPEMYYTPPIERMAQVDVSKGPDSILQGPQTIGGVLNYVTADPPKKPTVITEARVGNFGYWMAHVAAGDTVGPVGYRVDVLHRRFMGPRNLDLQLVDINGKMKVQFSPRHSLSVKLGVYDERSRSTYLGLTQQQYETNARDNFAIHDGFTVRRAGTGINHELIVNSALRLQTVVYGSVIQRNWQRQEWDREDLGFAYQRVVPGRPGDAAASGTSIFFRNANVHRNRRYFTGGVEPRAILALPLGKTDHQVIAGVRLHWERAEEQRVDGASGNDPSGEMTEEEVRTGVALSPYVQYRLTLFDRLRITPGIRLEAFMAERQVLRTRVPTDAGLVSQSVNVLERQPTYAIIPGLGLSYLAWQGLMFYAGVHRGFAPPRTKDNITTEGQNLRLEAEHSWNWEAGTRLAVGDFFTAETAVFLLDFQNQVIPPSEAGGATARDTGTGAPRLVNGGRTRHVGVETSMTLDLAAMTDWGFSVPYSVSYTFVDARWVDGVFEGNLLAYAPQHLLNTRVQFIHPAGFTAQLSGSYLSPQFTDNANSKLPSADGTTGVIGRRLLLDARVAYTFAPLGVTFSIAGKNLTDYRYIASRAPQGIQPGPFRQVMLGARWEL